MDKSTININNYENKIGNVPASFPHSTQVIGEQKTLENDSKELFRRLIPLCTPLIKTKEYIEIEINSPSSEILNTHTNIHIEKRLVEEMGEQGGQTHNPPQNIHNKPDPVVAKFHAMSVPEIRDTVRLLLSACGLPGTIGGVAQLERDYKKLGFDLWEVSAGGFSTPISKPPRGASGFYFLGFSGRVLPGHKVHNYHNPEFSQS